MEVSMDKRLTELENKFTPIGDGVYSVDPNSTWPPTRGEYKMKDEMSRNKIVNSFFISFLLKLASKYFFYYFV